MGITRLNMDAHTSPPTEAIVTHTEFDSVPAKLDDVIDEVNALSDSFGAADLSGIATNTAAITAINTLLASDDTTLDELQEIVDFIKTNKTTLDALGISSISGLQTALDAKEAALGNPGADGYVLSSTTLGARTWVAQSNAAAYGAISVEGNATATAIAAASTDFSNKVQVTIFDNDSVANGVTPDHTNDHITISTDGAYEISAPSVSFYGAGGRTYSFAIFINNGATQIGTRTTRKLGTGGDIGALPVSALATLSAGDTVELWVQNESNTGDLTVQDVSLCVKGL